MENNNGNSNPNSNTSRTIPLREDWWSDEQTETLIEAWGARYLALNRGHLRQRHWQQATDEVNRNHPTKNRSFVQCKNRMDTLKRRYKVEKAVVESDWKFFPRLDYFICGDVAPRRQVLAIEAPPEREVVVLEGDSDDSHESGKSLANGSQRESEELEENMKLIINGSDKVSKGTENARSAPRQDGQQGTKVSAGGDGTDGGYEKLAMAVEKLGEIYLRVGKAGEKMMVELEKNRMMFSKEMEIQRMQMFLDSQILTEKIKKARQGTKKRARDDDEDDDGQMQSTFNMVFDSEMK